MLVFSGAGSVGSWGLCGEGFSAGVGFWGWFGSGINIDFLTYFAYTIYIKKRVPGLGARFFYLSVYLI